MTLKQRYPVAKISEHSVAPPQVGGVPSVPPTPLMTVLAAQMCIYAVESAPTCSEASRLYRATLACVPMHD